MSEFEWRAVQPPRRTVVAAKYRDDEEWRLVKTCGHGCCVIYLGSTMVLPKWWREATRQEVIKYETDEADFCRLHIDFYPTPDARTSGTAGR